jgi:hypothetical protein
MEFSSFTFNVVDVFRLNNGADCNGLQGQIHAHISVTARVVYANGHSILKLGHETENQFIELLLYSGLISLLVVVSFFSAQIRRFIVGTPQNEVVSEQMPRVH